MARPFTPKVLTANRLIEGDVVYYAANGDWVFDHNDAFFIQDEAEANALLAKAAVQANILVGAYLANAVLENGAPTPSHFREDFRATGPSNYNHGKQAQV